MLEILTPVLIWISTDFRNSPSFVVVHMPYVKLIFVNPTEHKIGFELNLNTGVPNVTNKKSFERI